MTKYENMKKSKNGMPTWDSFLEPILKIYIRERDLEYR